MTNFTAIGSAIYARLGTVQYTYPTNGTVTTTGTLGLYESLAPQNPTTNPPYVIYQYQAGFDTYTFGTRAGEEAQYIVKVVSDRLWANTQAWAIYETLHAHLQDAPLSVGGHQLLRCRRRRQLQYRDSSGHWHVGGLYAIDTWQT